LRHRFSFEESEADYKELWLRETNSVYAFLQDLLSGKLVDSLGARAEKVETNEFYQLYVKYCENEEKESIPKKTFTDELERLGFKRVKVSGYYYYKGIKLIKVKERKEENEETNGLENWLS